MSNYKFSFNNEPQDLEYYKDIFRINGIERNPHVLRWMHLENPLKDNLICYAFPETKDNEVAALYTVFPVIFRINNRTIKGCQSIDTITDSRHRGKGLFTECAKQCYDLAEKKGYGMVYGFPNSLSAGGFFKKLGWKSVTDSAPFLILPLKSKYFTKKILPNSINGFFPNINLKRKVKRSFDQVKGITAKENDLGKIWRAYHCDSLIGVERNNDYLRWRLTKPDEDYITIGLYEKNKLVAFLTYTIKNKHDGVIGYVMEYLFIPEYEEKSVILLDYMANSCIDNNVDCILAWCLKHSRNYRNMTKIGFKGFPKILRPIELNVGARIFNTKERDLYNFDHWYLSYLDSDTV